MEIYEDGKIVGSLQLQERGLYILVQCQCEPCEKIRRVYLAYPYSAKYLGIANRQGFFQTQIPKKQFPDQFYAVSSTAEKNQWLPWRGEIDGILIESALICESEIAMPLNEAMKFPAWELGETEVNKTKMALLPLSADGEPLPREREAERNETTYYDNFADSDLADLPADECVGGTGWQADCADI